jgi:uncharacterized membrane protein
MLRIMDENRDRPTRGGPLLTTRRIEALADGVFAFAMTFLVINLTLPDVANGVGLSQLLLENGHRLFNFILSFLLLASFWVVHHEQSHTIARTNRAHAWINILIFMFVALMPFSTDVVGDWGEETLADLLFSANLLALGLLCLANWVYSYRAGLFGREVSAEEYRTVIWRHAVTPIVAALVMVASLFVPGYALWAYAPIPIIINLPMFRTGCG